MLKRGEKLLNSGRPLTSWSMHTAGEKRPAPLQPASISVLM